MKKVKNLINIYFNLYLENLNELNSENIATSLTLNNSPKKNKKQIFLIKKHKKNSKDFEFEYNKKIKNEYYTFIKFKNINEIENAYNLDKNLIEETENLHLIRKNYLNNQINLTIKKRTILFDWMMEISNQLFFKRETYYLAITLVDIYFSIINSVLNTEEIQLIGVACLLISCKLDNVSIPSIKVFAYACEFCYTNQEIIDCHNKILETLKWKINYPTLNEWGISITFKWDLISEKLAQNNIYLPKFRNDKKFKNKLLFEFFLLLDLITLDYYSIFMNEKEICISLIFYIIGLYFQYFTKEEIINNFENCNDVFNLNKFKIWFEGLCEKEFDLQRNELNSYLIYTGQFFHLNFEYKNINVDNEINLQKQTYNGNNIKSIKEIYKLRPNNEFL